ncbi:cysteine desulfurase [Macrococcus hajekii]|uniref:cysteine desulfurase n=1 Tax=Macrococcus hajekii TaxID=198482 RepID=A0A4R6BM10_9STAP|nr:cysteine desulfurase family protein [Macrococcus hajekii]TDM02836.1 cysteine desulfurase [Macrococcus hajekii]GGB04288.1 cysteine desulfurase [Macrococcus hajekii]
MEVYADYAATTPVAPEVRDVMMDIYSEQFGNPSSIHRTGRAARQVVDEARRQIAKVINASPKDILFTSGATESNNTAIKGAAYKRQHLGRHLITTQIEHHSVLHVFEYLEKQGFEVTYLAVNRYGEIDLNDLEQALRPDTTLVSIMFGNNEVGAIQQIGDIAVLLIDHQALLHTDAVQAAGHMPIDVKELNIDLLSLTAHKFYGPKGIGLLYIKPGTDIEFQQLGGSQETKRRAGTENVPLIKGMATALTLATDQMDARNVRLMQLKEHFLNALQDRSIPFEMNGNQNMQLPHIMNLYFPFSDVEIILTLLDMAGVYVSSGSACTAGSIEPSHVLTAMFGTDARTKQSIRFSFSSHMAEEQIDYIADQLLKIYEMNKERSE